MKRLLQNSGLFVVILLLIKTPFIFFDRDETEIRRSELAMGDYDTVFMGSSRTRDAIDTFYFDSQTNGKTGSYNFGVPAGLPPDTFDWCEEIIRTKRSLKYIFFELGGLIENVPVDKLPPRYFSISSYVRTVSLLPYDRLSSYHDRLSLAIFKPDLQREYGRFNEVIAHRTESEMRALSERTSFSFQLNQRMETVDCEPEAPVHEEYWRRINDLIDLAESRQIRIYFYIPPRLETELEFRTLCPIYHRLDPKHKLNPMHDDKMLYQPEMSSDEFHLDHDAAMRFTRQFAEAFNERQR